MRLSPHEFLRRFLLHVLPAGFKRIRHYGLSANRSKATQLAACRAVLDAPAPTPPRVESAEAFLIRLTGRDVRRCPHCPHGRLVLVHHLPPPMRLPELRATDRLLQYDEPAAIQSPLAVVAKRAGPG